MHKSACSDNSISTQYVLHFPTIIRTPPPSFYWIYATVNSNRNIKIDIFMCISALLLELQQLGFEAIFCQLLPQKELLPFDVVSSSATFFQLEVQEATWAASISLFRYNNFVEIWVDECIICFAFVLMPKTSKVLLLKDKKLHSSHHDKMDEMYYWLIPKVHWVHLVVNCTD